MNELLGQIKVAAYEEALEKIARGQEAFKTVAEFDKYRQGVYKALESKKAIRLRRSDLNEMVHDPKSFQSATMIRNPELAKMDKEYLRNSKKQNRTLSGLRPGVASNNLRNALIGGGAALGVGGVGTGAYFIGKSGS